MLRDIVVVWVSTESEPLSTDLCQQIQCKQCRIKLKDEKLVLSILSKLGSEYFVFVSTFRFGRDSIPNWNIPSLDSFFEFLIQEKE